MCLCLLLLCLCNALSSNVDSHHAVRAFSFHYLSISLPAVNVTTMTHCSAKTEGRWREEGGSELKRREDSWRASDSQRQKEEEQGK